MNSVQQSSSILPSLIPLLGVIIGSALTFAITLFTSIINNRRNEVLYRRQKLGRLYILMYNFRQDVQKLSIGIIMPLYSSSLNDIRQDLGKYLETLTKK